MRRFALAALVAMAGYPAVGTARANGDGWIPRARHYDALERSRDCGIYRSVRNKADQEAERQRKTLAAVKALLEERRAELEKCGAANGLANVTTEAEDERLAEVCAGAYQAWLAPGYRLMMLEEDLSGTSASLQQLSDVIREQCGAETMVKTGKGGPRVPPVSLRQAALVAPPARSPVLVARADAPRPLAKKPAAARGPRELSYTRRGDLPR